MLNQKSKSLNKIANNAKCDMLENLIRQADFAKNLKMDVDYAQTFFKKVQLILKPIDKTE